MERLRDRDNHLMIFYVQDELDPVETVHKKTWRSVGRALLVDPKDLDKINTCYQALQSPTEILLQFLKAKGDEEPTMRYFVKALIECKRCEVAQTICNWPWEINEPVPR